jgi:hypothetical protein
MRAAGYYTEEMGTVLLTTDEQQHLSDDELLAIGEAEAKKRGYLLNDDYGVVVADYSNGKPVEWPVCKDFGFNGL